MPETELIIDPRVLEAFDRYPPHARKMMEALRKLIIDTAEEMDEVQSLEETLKWGEPSYIAKKGSTIRIDWKPRAPEHYAMYFSCTSKLVPTFRLLFNGTFTFEGNRAIVFDLYDDLPTEALRSCIRAALRYHLVKDDPMLGIS